MRINNSFRNWNFIGTFVKCARCALIRLKFENITFEMFGTFLVSFIYLEKTSLFSDLQNVMAFKNSKKKRAISSNNVIPKLFSKHAGNSIFVMLQPAVHSAILSFLAL